MRLKEPVGGQTELSESTMDNINGAIEIPGNPLDQMIERWWEDHFPGSAVARDRVHTPPHPQFRIDFSS